MLILQPVESPRDTQCRGLFFSVFALHSATAYVHILPKSKCRTESNVKVKQMCGHVFQVLCSQLKGKMGAGKVIALLEALLMMLAGNLSAENNMAQKRRV